MSSNIARTADRIRHHYEVEKELAGRLRGSTREERTEMFKSLYSELFQRVPDHPRLTRRNTLEASARKVAVQMRLVEPFLQADAVFVEFAPGDCRLGAAVAAKASRVIGIDISDQRAPNEYFPDNFELHVYDGYSSPLPDNSADVVFSYQFLEHLHPDDVEDHFQLVRRLLKKGGVYIFDTPHRYSGPHDVSRHFGNTLDCFHFQEWTYREMRTLLRKSGFTGTQTYRFGRPCKSKIVNAFNDAAELFAGLLPSHLRRPFCSRLFQSVTMVGLG